MNPSINKKRSKLSKKGNSRQVSEDPMAELSGTSQEFKETLSPFPDNLSSTLPGDLCNSISSLYLQTSSQSSTFTPDFDDINVDDGLFTNLENIKPTLACEETTYDVMSSYNMEQQPLYPTEPLFAEIPLQFDEAQAGPSSATGTVPKARQTRRRINTEGKTEEEIVQERTKLRNERAKRARENAKREYEAYKQQLEHEMRRKPELESMYRDLLNAKEIAIRHFMRVQEQQRRERKNNK